MPRLWFNYVRRLVGCGRAGNGGTPVWLLVLMAAALVVGWFVNAVRPPPPTPCGTPGAPPRVRTRDGRYLAYAESGVSRDKARFKVVYSHGFSGNRMDSPRAAPPRFVVLAPALSPLLFSRASFRFASFSGRVACAPSSAGKERSGGAVVGGQHQRRLHHQPSARLPSKIDAKADINHPAAGEFALA
jgi:hypothetical protein